MQANRGKAQTDGYTGRRRSVSVTGSSVDVVEGQPKRRSCRFNVSVGRKQENKWKGSKRLTCIRSLFVPAALGEGAVRTAFFYFHDGPAYSFGKHRVMLLSSGDRKTDRQMDRKADWPLKFTCSFGTIQTDLHDSAGWWIDVFVWCPWSDLCLNFPVL